MSENHGRTELELLTSQGAACVHHWVLADPVAGVIGGRCKRCSRERQFPATPEGTDRFDDYRDLTQSAVYDDSRPAR